LLAEATVGVAHAPLPDTGSGNKIKM
jgi:hypothetical protein